jgi:alcohol dehydrogenase class IV
MTRRIGLPVKLSELGVEESLFPAIIAGALKDHTHKTNPREASHEDYQAMLSRSY